MHVYFFTISFRKWEFTLLPGFGESSTSFINNEDPLHIEQVMLQGSSSAAPMYNITSDVSLAAYKNFQKESPSFILLMDP